MTIREPCRLENLRRSPYCKALSMIIFIALTQALWIVPANSETSTHSVFVEVFASTWCEPCSREQILIQGLFGNRSHLAHFVVFHLQDIWSTTDAVNRATELNFNFVPSHTLDGGYTRTSGAIVDAYEIETVSLRSVHLIELTVTKAINGNLLSSQVAVAERNGYLFNGEVAIYVVENGIYLNRTEWNSVYRGQVTRQGVLLKPNSYQVVSGNWSIPIGVKADNLEVIAVVFDKGTMGKYGPYVVQSACSKDRSLAIPEFDRWLPLLVASTLLVSVSILRVARDRLGLTAYESRRSSSGKSSSR